MRLEDKSGWLGLTGQYLELCSAGRTVVKLVSPEELKLEMEREQQVHTVGVIM